MHNIFTRNWAKVEGTYGEVDAGSLWYNQAILKKNIRSIFLQMKTTSHKSVMPILVI